MNGQRKPRRPRWAKSINTLDIALYRATKLLPDEIATRMDPLRAAMRALREGRATEQDWQCLASAVNVALSIEKKGVVRGLRLHLQSADLALAAIQMRATQEFSRPWQPTALYFNELDDMTAFIDLFDYQLHQLSAKEYDQAFNHAMAETIRTGGVPIKATPKPIPFTQAPASA